MSLAAGQILQQRYQIEHCIGRGGMGTVYRAWDTVSRQWCAVKENDLDTGREQFEREAAILASLRHPNLPQVLAYFFIPGQGQYLVMEFVPGEDLQAMLTRLGMASEAQVLAWAGQICQALTYLHSRPAPIIHRDLKPANIKIRPDGRVVLVDFGIAKIYQPRQRTLTGARGTTTGFSPPEQYSQGTTDVRSDIYALGATLYALLTGQRPADALERLARNAPLIPPRRLNPHLSPAVEQAVLTAMELTANRRFQRVSDFQAALTRRREPARWPLPAGLSIVVGLVVVALAAGLLMKPSVAPAPAPPLQPTSPQSRLVFESDRDGNNEIYTINSDGSSVTRLTHQSADDGDPAWSPDGTRIAFASNRAGDWNIYVIDAAGHQETRLTDDPAADSFPAWSPNGQQIAFHTERDGNAEIYRINLDDRTVVRLTDHPATDTFPAWSPDGRQIAFASNRNGHWGIYVMNADGSELSQLINNSADNTQPEWSPDGHRLAFVSNRDGNYEIYLLNIANGEQTRLTYNPARDLSPTWSPEGTRLAFHSNRDGNEQIYLMNTAGGEQIRLTHNLVNDSFPAWSP